MAGGVSRVVVVTGGAAGIGAAIAEELGRTGAYVVTLDANVTLDGSGTLTSDEPSTARRIVAAGGAARAVQASVTDADGVASLFGALAVEFGTIDAVVNAAGISRPTSFTAGEEADWEAVLAVHVDGYLNVLRAALPIMAAAGRGTIVGLTSGSGWRAANTGAYGCAKRAVASLTWQLGRVTPPGVVITALSPIAATRMVTASLAPGSVGRRSAGISLDGFPPPQHLGPVGAFLAEGHAWSNGRVFFSAGAELTLVSEPQLLEAVRSRQAPSLTAVLDAVLPAAFVPAEQSQSTGGGAKARFADLFTETFDSPETPGDGTPDTPGAGSSIALTSVASGSSGDGTPATSGAGSAITPASVSPGTSGDGNKASLADQLSEPVASPDSSDDGTPATPAAGSTVALASVSPGTPGDASVSVSASIPAPVVETRASSCVVVTAGSDPRADLVSALTRRGLIVAERRKPSLDLDEALDVVVLASASTSVLVGGSHAGADAVASHERVVDAHLELVEATPPFAERATSRAAGADVTAWERVLDDHVDLTRQVRQDAASVRAIAGVAMSTKRLVRMIALVDASTPGGRSRAAALTQLSRASGAATDGLVTACVVSRESDDQLDQEAAAELVACLASRPSAVELSGAELCVGAGWVGLRSHPRPSGTVSYGGPELPDWVGAAVESMVTGRSPGGPTGGS